jgi:xanthine dehydrogenase YagS FAD-binding subunit
MAVALVALDAVVHYVTAEGRAALPMSDFHRLPGDDPARDTHLPPGALITGVEVPPLSFAATSTYRKARDRRSYASEELLRGAPATADSFRAAAEAELAAATPTDENRFKIDLVTRLVTGTLLELTGGA